MKTDPMFLIYSEHQAFLKGKRRKLAQQREALDSLAAFLGLPTSLDRQGCAGRSQAGLWVASVMFILAGGALVMSSIIFFSEIYRTHPVPLGGVAFASMYLTLGMLIHALGHQAVIYAYLFERYPVYVKQLYNQLIDQGEIAQGTVIDVKQGPPEVIRYRFDMPSGYESCEGEYRLFTQVTLVPGQKVTVLYLSRSVHLLL